MAAQDLLAVAATGRTVLLGEVRAAVRALPVQHKLILRWEPLATPTQEEEVAGELRQHQQQRPAEPAEAVTLLLPL